MDFNDTPEEAKFRAKAATWLSDNKLTGAEKEGLDIIAQAKLWQKRKADAGWTCIRWPKKYGGRDASAMEQVIWGQEESKIKPPVSMLYMVGHGMGGPTMMTWATKEQKQKHIPRMASGEEIWCQLFSEPAGGSDLAALRTKAERDGDEWIVNGQKIWTSMAQHADFGILVLRTDPEVPKHKGLTYFYIDMKSPGIEIKPIRQMSGASGFNEVFFTNVRVPDSQRLGKVGQGWEVAITTLMNERASIGGGGSSAGFKTLMKLAEEVYINDEPAIKNQVVRSKLADWYVQEAGMKYTGLRSVTALSRGEAPGPESSISKLVAGPKTQDLSSFALDLMDQAGVVLTPGSREDNLFQASYMSAPGFRIAGGTDEIMANIIAERVLGMPQEPRMDKGIPFSEVPTSK
ncbi:MAG: acyl-CoA dehydrogenase family protein [Pseudomonadales bacterium]|nr:acyl-CoA dehydrogenase family protein [Pseudomonadales bacterium]